MPRGSNFAAQPGRQRRHRRRLRAERRDRARAAGSARISVAWPRRQAAAIRARASVPSGSSSPDQPAAPVVDHLGRRSRATSAGAVGRLHRQPPDRARRARRTAPHRAPPRHSAALPRLHPHRAEPPPAAPASRPRPVGDRPRHPLEPQQRRARPAAAPRPLTSKGDASAAVIAATPAASSRPVQHQRRLGLGHRLHLEARPRSARPSVPWLPAISLTRS